MLEQQEDKLVTLTAKAAPPPAKGSTKAKRPKAHAPPVRKNSGLPGKAPGGKKSFYKAGGKFLAVDAYDVDNLDKKPSLENNDAPAEWRTPASDALPKEKDGRAAGSTMFAQVADSMSRSGVDPAQATISDLQKQLSELERRMDATAMKRHGQQMALYNNKPDGSGIIFV